MSSLLNACKLASGNVGSKIDLLPHNQMLYDKIVNEIENGERSIFYSQATGLGKSFIFMRLVQDYFMDKKILYIVPKIAIWNNLINYSDFNNLNKDNIEMATYASFNKYDSTIADKYDIIFADECHHMLSDVQGNNVCKCFIDMLGKGKYVFGMTATPFYNGQYVDEVCFEKSCFGLDVFEAIEQGILPKIKLALANLDLDEVPYDLRARYSITGTESLLNKLLREHNDITRWLVYFSNKADLEASVKEIEELFPDYEILKVYQGVEKEYEVIEQFRKSNRKVVLLSVSKLLEGIHISNVGGVLLYRNVTEFSTYMQIYGRLCDIKSKTTPVLLDVTNSIVNITRVSDFKSSKFTGVRKTFDKRDLFDVNASDYWTIELSELIGKGISCYYKFEDGTECFTLTDIASKLNIPRSALYSYYNKHNKDINTTVSYYLNNNYRSASESSELYYEFEDGSKCTGIHEIAEKLGVTSNALWLYYYSHNYDLEAAVKYYTKPIVDYRGFKAFTMQELSLQLGLNEHTVTQYCYDNNTNNLEEVIDHFLSRSNFEIYRGVELRNKRYVAECLGKNINHVYKWFTDNPDLSLKDYVDFVLDYKETYLIDYRGIKADSTNGLAVQLGGHRKLIRRLLNEGKSYNDVIDYFLDKPEEKSYRGITWATRGELSIKLGKQKEACQNYLNNHPDMTEEDYIDYILGYVYRGVLITTMQDISIAFGFSSSYLTRIKMNNKFNTIEETIDYVFDKYPDIKSKFETNE